MLRIQMILGTFLAGCAWNTAAYAQGMQALGLGNSSCATIEKNGATTSWVGGFFSGVNWSAYSEGKNGRVGQHTDVPGIVGEVLLYCSNHPSDHIAEAVMATYNKLLKENK